MKIGPSTGADMDLRITGVTPSDHGMGLLIIEMTWDEWNALVADADYFRATGEVRP